MGLFVVAAATHTVHSLHQSIQQPRIWPAAQVEIYRNESVYVSACPDQWAFEYVGEWTQVADVLQAARGRFQQALRNKLPSTRSPCLISRALVGESNPIVRVQITTSDKSLQQGVDESYRLSIAEQGIHISAPTVFGTMHALQTLLQLVAYSGDTDQELAEHGRSQNNQLVESFLFVIHDTPISIRDRPLYPYRGLLIDTSRHFLPVDSIILRNLDAMAMNKLNVLHWHLTDSQSWPYANQAYPEMAEQGAYCRECVYTADTIRMIVREAALRGIRVIVEVDLPGHCQCTYLHTFRSCSCDIHRNRLLNLPILL